MAFDDPRMPGAVMEGSKDPGAATQAPDLGQTDVALFDMGVIADAVLRHFAGRVTRERVLHLLSELLAHEFGGVRVTNYLPIFLHRTACEALRRELDGHG